MGFLGNFLNEDKNEILFFIIVFLILFNGNNFGKGFDKKGILDDSEILFFIIVFLLLFFNRKYDYDLDY